MEHPTVSSPCECHYAGRLLDGSEFDSSYKRGSPTTFAPNQVIKGWTEAMQLMVVGDKWEMYIPMEMAYGPSGKPPKIPGGATLIFIMEIIKIKGDKVAKQMVFPTWTADELALWLDKDEAACQSWRAGRSEKWEAGDEKLRASYPTREELDAFLDKGCESSKNKSLWKRTRTAKKKAAAPSASTASAPAKLTKDTARALLTKALDTFKEPANKEKLAAAVKECEGAGEQADMMKMMKLMPMVTEMVGPTLSEYGFGSSSADAMGAITQVSAFGEEDPSIKADVGMLMKAVQGDLSAFL
uniref:peptidylprolyl isomerase n=1 Tax=Haptolina ericina TaxID=156174 RepID=A0A7S3FA55_9EUKA